MRTRWLRLVFACFVALSCLEAHAGIHFFGIGFDWNSIELPESLVSPAPLRGHYVAYRALEAFEQGISFESANVRSKTITNDPRTTDDVLLDTWDAFLQINYNAHVPNTYEHVPNLSSDDTLILYLASHGDFMDYTNNSGITSEYWEKVNVLVTQDREGPTEERYGVSYLLETPAFGGWGFLGFSSTDALYWLGNVDDLTGPQSPEWLTEVNWSRTILFVDACRSGNFASITKFANTSLAVVTASDAAGFSLHDGTWSMMAYGIEYGLNRNAKGEYRADQAATGNKDGSVSLRELTDYINEGNVFAQFEGQEFSLGVDLSGPLMGQTIPFDGVNLTVAATDSFDLDAPIAGPLGDNPPVPEPTSFVLWSALGVMGIIASRRRKRAA